MASHNDLGKQGEELAVGFLKQKGFSILATNWKNRHEEIDIIARKENILHIVEVKTRSGNLFGEPEEFVSSKKQKLLIKATNAYVERYQSDEEIVFDIISIVFSGDQYRINHIEDAFYATIHTT